ncbi:MAG: MFS superfamily sulfate permease-like transporter [Flavobacteriaceae bacterium]|jgi:MFS superfamily sulfate permease-like transporter
MKSTNNTSPLKNFKDDIPASIVVFLVAMPLCLGIAMASGAPLFSGIISGIVGGIVVGALSGSPLGVSGPAAGLAVIVLNAITDLGGFEIFLVAVILAGIIQLIIGFAKAGIIAHYFPSSVIQGMLAGIGIIIFLKQIPHAFGYDKDPEGDFEFSQVDGHNTFEELAYMFENISLGVLIISSVSLLILIIWGTSFFKKLKFTKLIQGPLVVVVLGVLLAMLFQAIPELAVSKDHFVSVPVASSVGGFLENFAVPDFANGLSNPDVYITAIVIAVVASLETLLCVEASDKQDVMKRVTPTNRELKAQGVGNVLTGLIGGLPVTQVIVRSSANQQSGGKTKASTILHGVLLLASVIAIPTVLNMIPLGVLAAILLVVGFKLSKPALYVKMFKQGMEQFLPFLITVLGIVFMDMLMGIALGLVVAIFIILRNNYKIPYEMNRENLAGKESIEILLSEDVTFLNKASIQKSFMEIPDNTLVKIDASKNRFIHHDVVEIIEDFQINAKSRNIEVEIHDLYKNKSKERVQHFKLSN